MLSEILNFNREFVARKDYLPYQTTKYPDRKLAILTCMDTRLTHLLPAALGLRNGEVKMIKNAGGVVLAPYGGVVRSLLVAVLELGVEEILVIGHTDCGVCGMRPEVIRQHLLARGIAPEILSEIDEAGRSGRLVYRFFRRGAGGAGQCGDAPSPSPHASGCGHPRPDHRFVHGRAARAGAGRPENVKIPLDTGLEIWYSN